MHEFARADRGRVAVRQRPAAHRPRLGLRGPLRRLLPLHADERARRVDGVRHRRARHADPGPGRTGGSEPARGGRQVQPRHRRGPAGSRPVLRPLHPHDHAKPLPGGAGSVPGLVSQRLRGAEDGDGRGQPEHRPHPARPLHRGHLPDLRLRRCPRRSVRQLRQPARPGGSDQPAFPDQRRDAGVRRDRALLPGSAGPVRIAREVAGGAHRLATQRVEVQPESAGGSAPARHHARSRLGRTGSAGRLAGPVR